MGEEVQVRFVGEKYIDAACPGTEISPVEPTLEDYYIFAGGREETESGE